MSMYDEAADDSVMVFSASEGVGDQIKTMKMFSRKLTECRDNDRRGGDKEEREKTHMLNNIED